MKLSLHEKLRSIRAASTDEGFVPISHALCKELEAALAAFGTTSYDSDDEMFADLEAHRKAVQGQAAERDGANIAASGTLTDALIRAIHNAEDDGAAVLAVSEILRSQIAHLAKATTEPTREQTVTDAMVEDAIEAYNDCASYNTQAVNMRAALEAALIRAEAKP